MGDKVALSVKDMPKVDRVLHCALPVLYVDVPVTPAWVGVGGTCFAVRWGGRTLFVTAGHVVAAHPVGSLAVPTAFGGELRSIGIRQVVTPEAVPRDDPDQGDVAVLTPGSEPGFDAEWAVPLEMTGYADMTKITHGWPLALRGYPRATQIDYDLRVLDRSCYATPGTYEGPSAASACHVMQTSMPADGADGFSGAPVLALRWRDDEWEGALAGMIVRGGSAKVHFVDVERVLALLRTTY